MKNILNKFKNKIENIEGRDKLSILIGMFSFLILINFSDFSGFKASIISTGTGETIQEEVVEDTKEEIKEVIKEEIEEKNEEENILENNLENDLENNLENEILEEEISELKEEIIISENSKTEEITISENPILVENSTQTSEIENNLEDNLEDINQEGINQEDFLEEIGVEKIDKNAETLALLEAEEMANNKIEIISEVPENFSNEEEKNFEEEEKNISDEEDISKEENISNEENISDEESILDQKIETAIQNIQEIEDQQKQDKLIQERAEILAQEIISKQAQNSGLPEGEFLVSGEETENYNKMVRQKKEDEIISKYEKQISEKEKENKDLMDRIEMLENKLNNITPKKTAEEIAAEKKELSLREIAKKEAAEKLKILEAEKAEKIKIAKIESNKRKIALELFNKDSDLDGLSDHIEKIIETNEKLIDTDGDGYGDKIEIEKFFNPNSEGILFPDISEGDPKRSTIINGIKKGLVFVRTGDKFLAKESIYRNEAIKIIVSAMYPSEIYRENEFFEGIELYSDVSSSDDYARYLAIAIKHGILDGIIADNFNPYSTFSKAEFIKILINASGKTESNKKLKWVDTELDNWFTGFFSKAKEIGIIKTETYNRIFPLKEISRYEAILYSIRASKYGN